MNSGITFVAKLAHKFGSEFSLRFQRIFTVRLQGGSAFEQCFNVFVILGIIHFINLF